MFFQINGTSIEDFRHDQVVQLLANGDSISLVVTRDTDALEADALNQSSEISNRDTSTSQHRGKSTASSASAVADDVRGDRPVAMQNSGPKRRSKRGHGSSSDVAGAFENAPAEPAAVTSQGYVPSQPKTPNFPGTHSFAADQNVKTSAEVGSNFRKLLPKSVVVAAQDVSPPLIKLDSGPVVVPMSPPATVATDTIKIQSSPIVQLKSRNLSSGKQKLQAKGSESKSSLEPAADKNDNVTNLFNILNRNFNSVSTTGSESEQNANSWRNSNGAPGHNRDSYGFDSLYSRNQPFPVEVSLTFCLLIWCFVMMREMLFLSIV